MLTNHHSVRPLLMNLGRHAPAARTVGITHANDQSLNIFLYSKYFSTFRALLRLWNKSMRFYWVLEWPSTVTQRPYSMNFTFAIRNSKNPFQALLRIFKQKLRKRNIFTYNCVSICTIMFSINYDVRNRSQAPRQTLISAESVSCCPLNDSSDVRTCSFCPEFFWKCKEHVVL